MTKTVIEAPLPTNRTVRGPRINYEDGKLLVEYDHEQDDGSVVWTKILFTETLFYGFADNSCDEIEDILSPTEIRQQSRSELLSSVLSRWYERYGSTDWQNHLGGCGRFAHFTVYFDHAGAVNVIASGCVVG